LFYQINQS
jgi:hypothetical protein